MSSKVFYEITIIIIIYAVNIYEIIIVMSVIRKKKITDTYT